MAIDTMRKAEQNAAAKTDGRKTMQDFIRRMQPEIAKALPQAITPERFTRLVLSALSVNPKLGECAPTTFLGGMMQAAQLGLEPNTPIGQCYLIPRYSKKRSRWECVFEMGYQGLIDLAYRSGNVSVIQAQAVRANDVFDYSFGLDPTLKHIPAPSDRGPVTHYWAAFRTPNGGYGFEVWSYDDVYSFAKKRSDAFENGPWQTDFDSMAKKTVLKQALKYAPKRSDFTKAITTDETVRLEITPDMFDAPSEVIDIEPTTGEAIDADEAPRE